MMLQYRKLSIPDFTSLNAPFDLDRCGTLIMHDWIDDIRENFPQTPAKRFFKPPPPSSAIEFFCNLKWPCALVHSSQILSNSMMMT